MVRLITNATAHSLTEYQMRRFSLCIHGENVVHGDTHEVSRYFMLLNSCRIMFKLKTA